MKKPKVIVALPAYNAAATLEKTVADVPMEYVSEFILVDDVSKDETFSVAKRLKSKISKPFTIYQHDQNLGYGGNQKTCYTLALKRGADIVVMLHPDYQYDPKLIKYFVEFIRDGYFDVVLGSRVRSRKETLAGGMPPYKYIANRLLTLWYNMVSGYNLSEWHTGMRAYSRKALETIEFEKFSDDFVFDTQMLFAIVGHSFRVGDIPVPCRYFKEASSINLRRSICYGLAGVWESFKHLARRIFKREV
ncbi:MAG: glycosyltransferase family 2 protein [Candidatus Taylorbacteria bacterium]|nr:glycosyltransferase family 2 protein [Candidatus Taylorbacteria bacterium]